MRSDGDLSDVRFALSPASPGKQLSAAIYRFVVLAALSAAAIEIRAPRVNAAQMRLLAATTASLSAQTLRWRCLPWLLVK